MKEKEFISIYDGMPPVNRLCECRLKNREHTMNARFINDLNTDKYWFASVAKENEIPGTKEGTFIHVPPVVSWCVIESKEDAENWLLHMSKYSLNDPSSDSSTPFSDLERGVPSEV